MYLRKEIIADEDISNIRRHVVIQVLHLGMTHTIPTSVYIKERNWDSKECRITPGEDDADLKNEIIDSIYLRIAVKIQN